MTYTNITRVAIFPLLLVGMFFLHAGTAQAYYGNPYPAAYNNNTYYNTYSGNSPYGFGSSYPSSYGYNNSYGYGGYGYSAPLISASLFYTTPFDNYGYQNNYYPTYGGYGDYNYGYGYNDYSSFGCGCDFYSGY